MLSLHPAKILTTGEGGAVLTDRDDLADRLRRFRNHGIATELAARTDWTYAMVELGYNYRLTDIGAALGLVAARPARAVPRAPAGARRALPRRGSAGHRYLSTLPVGRAGRRAGLALHVRASSASIACGSTAARSTAPCAPRGSGSTSTTSRSTATPTTGSASRASSFPVAEAAYERLLTLPLHAGMTDADVDDVVAALDKVTAAYRAG